MGQKQKINICVSLITLLLSFNAYSQYGVIEMKDGKLIDVADSYLSVEKDSLRYFIEKFVSKPLFMGIGYKKVKKKMREISRYVKIDDIEKIHVEGSLLVNNRPVLQFKAIRYLKFKKRYMAFYELIDGHCRLLVRPEDSNKALYAYFVQKENEEPYKVHQVGILIGKKFKQRSKTFFNDCQPVLNYIDESGKDASLREIVKVYNEKCVK